MIYAFNCFAVLLCICALYTLLRFAQYNDNNEEFESADAKNSLQIDFCIAWIHFACHLRSLCL